MDACASNLLMVWILISWSPMCKSLTDCGAENFGLLTCCYNYPAPSAETFDIKCPEATMSIEVIDVIHLYGSSGCSDGNITHNCSLSENNIVWRSNSKPYLSNETCLTTSNECSLEVEPIELSSTALCNDTVAYATWSDAVVLTFNCKGGSDTSILTSIATSTNVVGTGVVDETSQGNNLVISSSTTIYVPIVETWTSSSSRENDVSYSSAVRSISNEEYPSSTLPASTGIMTYSTKAPAQQSVAGAIGGGIAAVVVVIVILIIIIIFVRRRKREKKNNDDHTQSNANGHTYTDIDSTKTKPKKSPYEEVYATQKKDFPLKHCDSHETNHYCYVGRNECLGKEHTNDKDQKLYDNPECISTEGEEKPRYDNVDNITYDTPKTNRVDNQDQNHYDNINEEVENKNNEKIDLYAIPHKAKTGVPDDKNKMSLKRNMDGSEYSIYPTLPAKCFDTLAEDPDRPKYAEIDMEKSGISASLRKNVDAKPSEDLNYAQIQF